MKAPSSRGPKGLLIVELGKPQREKAQPQQ